ncbi:MAG: hypothetical protein FWC26_02145, partial [Fibromonadales bacterium]|nr:hypothetical protein [Fibromonadales bacterium]
YGFSALPGGIGNSGSWWSTLEEERDSGLASFFGMYYDTEEVSCRNTYKTNLSAVRCVQN